MRSSFRITLNKMLEPASVVAIMVCGNDYCSGVSVESYRNHVREAVALVTQSHPQSTVLIGAVPPLDQLNNIQTLTSIATI